MDPSGWENYRSIEDDPEVCVDILVKTVNNGWALSFPSSEALSAHLGTNELILNKLGLVSKIKPDGSIKHRMVWDLRRSEVNSLVRQWERIVLPRLLDLIEDVLPLHKDSSGRGP